MSAPRAGLLGGGVAACAPAYGDGEAGAVVAVVVVSLRGCEGGLGGVSVYHDEDRVVRFMVAFVVLGCFDARVHDAGRAVALLECFSDIRRPVSAATSPFR